MKQKPYPAYKPSGVEWLGEVPVQWKVLALKRIVTTPVTDGPHETPEIFDEGIPFVSAEAIKNDKIDFTKIRGFILVEDHNRYSLKYKPRRNDIYIIKSGATTGNVAMVETDVEFNIWSPLAAIRPNLKISAPRFLFHFVKSKEFMTSIQLGWSFGTQQNIGMNVIENLSVTLPPLPEQQTIAAFLDRETDRIDTLVAKKERLIELLREKRSALISHAVTKGLEPSVKLKPSGVEWLGDVPHHWEVKSLRRAVENIRNGTSVTQLDDNGSMLAVTRIETISSGEINYEKVGYVEYDKDLAEYKLNIGNILLSHINSIPMIGNCAIYRGEYPLYSGMNLVRIVPKKDINSQWLWRVISSTGFKKILGSRAKPAINQASITTNQIKSMSIPFPPVHEQEAIATFLESETGKIDALIVKVEAAIMKLKEYRTALISAAVTGKIDVREAV